MSSNCFLLTRESFVRFDEGRLTEFGSGMLLAVPAVLGMDTSLTEVGKPSTPRRTAA